MRPKTKTILLIVAAFGLGIAAGAVGMLSFRGGHPSPRKWSQADMVRHFAERIHLDSAQTARVDTILAARRRRFDEFRTAMGSVRDSTRQEIRKLLSGEQNKLFEEYIQEMNMREEKERVARKAGQ